MSSLDLLTFVADSLYVVIFFIVLRRALRRPTPAHIDVALLFGSFAFIVVDGFLVTRVLREPPAWLVLLQAAAFVGLPVLLVRLLDDLSPVRPWIMWATAVGLVVSLGLVVVGPSPIPAPIELAIFAYFVVPAVYVGIAFARRSREAYGVTRRRLQAIAAGLLLLGATVVAAALQAVVGPEDSALLSALVDLLALLAGLLFFVGFVPPPILRRAWQEPELRAFLARAASLPRLPNTGEIIRELERGASHTVGAPATIGLWNERRGVLEFLRSRPSSEIVDVRPGELIGGRAFAEQRAIFTANAPKEHPEGRDVYRRAGVGAGIGAPITTADTRLGVLCVYANRAPVFAESDIELVRLLADQAAVILESRALIDEATRVAAQEEATRLKEDFLSAAAHDLKTPLTTLIAQAQFLDRKAERDPNAPMDRVGLARIVQEGRRLNALVLELLDASRLEQGKLVGEREPVDLVEVAQEVCARHERCELIEEGPVVGLYDRGRIVQVVENLMENALKYSPKEEKVTVQVRAVDSAARISVTDHGIGIPEEDVPHVFERFRRGSNVDERRFTGMGLGLYICQGIVQQHGGRIWVESRLGEGSSFEIEMPVAQEAAPAA